MGCQLEHPPHISLGSLLFCRRILQCCQVWARSSYTNLINTQLHSSMRLISGCLKPTQLPWLPVLSNVAPPSLRRTAATDKILRSEDHPNWPVHADVFEHPPTSTACISTSNMTSVDTTTQWREDWSSASVINHTIVTAKPFPNGPRSMSCKLAQMGPSSITFL